MAIRTVEDKNGNIILNPEQDIRKEQSAKGDKIQVISPQNAFVMTKLLEQTVNNGGTLAGQSWKFDYKTPAGKSYSMPAAGKTGTTQNWADAWTCGFTPYYAAAFWFGFDKPGQSLGLNITGSTLAGFAWGDFFREIHRDLPSKEFPKPLTGVIKATVCYDSGQILTDNCEKKTTQWFLEGTQPTEICTIHSSQTNSIIGIARLEREMNRSGQRWTVDFDSSPLKLDLDFLSGKSSGSSNNYSEYDSDLDSDDDNSYISTEKDYDYNYLFE